MTEKAPAFQFYVKDYETDEAVKMMSLEQEGAFLRLLCHAWLHGSIPSSVPQLAVICRVPSAKMARLWPGVVVCFQEAGPGRLVNARLEKGREVAHRYSEQQRQRGLESARRRQAKSTAVQQCSGSTAVQQNPGSTLRLQSPSPSAITETDTDNSAVSSSEKGVPENQRTEYAAAVWETFAKRTGIPERIMSPQEWGTLKGWMDEGIPLRVVLQAISETKNTGRMLGYFASSVQVEYERWHLALSGTA